jgi:hypothetical protein
MGVTNDDIGRHWTTFRQDPVVIWSLFHDHSHPLYNCQFFTQYCLPPSFVPDKRDNYEVGTDQPASG